MVSTITASALGITETNDSSGVLGLTGTSITINGAALSQSPFLEGTGEVGCIMSSCPKGDPQFGFTSSGPYTTFNNYSVGDNSSISFQAWHMATGDGYPNGTTQAMYSGLDPAFVHRKMIWNTSNRLGIMGRQVGYYPNQTSYTGVTFNLLPIRNTTGSPITRTMYWGFSSYWSAGYEGASVGLYTPNASTYSGTTGGTWSQPYSSTGSSTPGTSTNFSVTIPGNTTVILMGVCSWYYYTTYQFYDTNYWYNMNSFFDSTLICDMRMLETLAFGKLGGTYNAMDTHLAYTTCATLYGNR